MTVSAALLYFLDKTNITVTGLTALAILSTRSAGIAYFASGALATSLSVKYVLKRIIRQPRPTLGKKTYGMPSTHSASVAYYGAYITLAALYLPLHPSLPLAARSFPLFAVPWAGLVMLSRMWLGVHTISQVAAGCAYGVLCGCVAFGVWVKGMDEYGRIAERLINEWVESY